MIAPGSRIVVIPCDSQSLLTYSGSVREPPNAWLGVPKWAWASINPGITYFPAASMTRAFSPSSDSPRCNEPVPPPRISTMRSSSITIVKGPCGGAPVPSITLAFRITSRLNGPSLSSPLTGALIGGENPNDITPDIISSPGSAFVAVAKFGISISKTSVITDIINFIDVPSCTGN